MFITTSITGPVLILLLVLFLVLLIEFVLSSKSIFLFSCKSFFICTMPVRVSAWSAPVVVSYILVQSLLRAPPSVRFRG